MGLECYFYFCLKNQPRLGGFTAWHEAKSFHIHQWCEPSEKLLGSHPCPRTVIHTKDHHWSKTINCGSSLILCQNIDNTVYKMAVGQSDWPSSIACKRSNNLKVQAMGKESKSLGEMPSTPLAAFVLYFRSAPNHWSGEMGPSCIWS